MTGGVRQALRGLGWIALALTKTLTFAYAVEGAVRPDDPKYKGKGMRIRAVGYVGGLGLVPAWWSLTGRAARYPVAADLAVTVPLLIDAGGNSLGIYDDARLDDVVHGVNTAVLSSLFGAVISPYMESRALSAGAAVAFGIGGELAWELMEHVAEKVGFKGLGLSHEDTVADIAVAGGGALVAGVVTWARWRPSAEAPLVNVR
ncbi:MAG: hypothetical protein H0V04_07305 [Chloroflexi bacterium]|nr:hypothetical protein [Chloroflexota bacterium]